MTHLQEVGEIDKHVLVTGIFLPASDVQADGDDIHTLSALGKLVLQGERIESYGRVTYAFG